MTIQTATLAGLAKTNLREQALVALRSAITSGELPAGTHLVETELSERLQISRGTLREAMRQLQQEGLVTAGARGRLAVRTLDIKEIRDIFAVRAALEALAVRTLTEKDDRDSAVTVLRSCVERMDKALSSSLEERIEADLDFHRTLCELSENNTLVHAWKSLEGSIRMSFMWAGMERAVGNMRVDRHTALVEAITTGDARQASEVVFSHMAEAATNLVS